MKAMMLNRIAAMNEKSEPLELVDVPIPRPGAGEILLEVAACGVCHTELDEIEGRVAPAHLPIIPGHQVVGTVKECGYQALRYKPGDRLGVGWIFSSSGESDENVSQQFRATGCDVNGGYAEFMVVPENYAHSVPQTLSSIEAAPLLCAGSVGYRALRLANITNGDPLGLMGFGGSNHLVLLAASYLYPDSNVYVFTRNEKEGAFARSLGACWSGDITDEAPAKLKSIIDTTPVWKPLVEALKNLQAGGRLVINAIRKEDTDKEYLMHLSYEEHLWSEREIKSVANVTARDIQEFLQLAGSVPIRPTTQTFRLEEANIALRELKQGIIEGAKVLELKPGD